VTSCYLPDADSISSGHFISAGMDLKFRLNINDSFGLCDTFTNSQWETDKWWAERAGGWKTCVNFLVMVWELLSLELLLCHVYVSVPVCVVQLAATTEIPILFMFVHTVPK
jgi:hypothetical protein